MQAITVGNFVRVGRECHKVTATTEAGGFYTCKVQPPRKLRVPIFAGKPVPFGRRADVLSQLPDGVDRMALAWVEANPRDMFGGDFLYLFACPLALEIARETPTGQRKYAPAVRLS